MRNEVRVHQSEASWLDMQDVLWAVATRCEPAADMDILRQMRGTPLDPRLEPEKRRMGDLYPLHGNH